MTLIIEPGTLKPLSTSADPAVTILRLPAFLLKIVFLTLSLTMVTGLRAQQREIVPVTPPGSSPAPLPRVFISALPASGGKAYNEFYAAIKKLGQYELVNDPEQADQIFETNFTSPWHCVQNTVNPFEDVFYDPRFELVIRNRSGNILSGPYVVKAKPALLPKNQKKNSLLAIDAVVKWTAHQAVPVNATFATPEDAATEPPAPAPLSRSTTVFISSHVEDKTGAMTATGPDEMYRYFYDAMQKWGRYKLAPNAAGADLLIDLAVFIDRGQFCEDPGYDPQVTLRVTLPTTKLLVYGFSRQLQGRMSSLPHGGGVTSLRPSQQDLQKTAAALVDELRRQAARGAAAASPTSK